MANGYQDVMNSGAQRYRRRLRGESRFGNVEESSLSPIREALDTAISGITGRQQREMKQERDQFEQTYIDRSLKRLEGAFKGPRPLSVQESNLLLDKTTVDLLRHGGSKARQTASDIQKLRKQDKGDMSLTPEEAYMRGQISYGELQKIKKAGKSDLKEKTGFKWRQRETDGKAATETVGGETYFIEEETDLQGRPTGATRRKAASKSRTSLIGWGGGGKASIDIPVSVDPITGKPVYRQIEGTREDVVKQIKASAKSLDATVKKLSVAKGSKGFLGIGAKDSWEKFLNNPNTKIDDLPRELQPYAVAYEELLTKLNEVDVGGGPDGRQNEQNYGWQYVDEE